MTPLRILEPPLTVKDTSSTKPLGSLSGKSAPRGAPVPASIVFRQSLPLCGGSVPDALVSGCRANEEHQSRCNGL